jgi:ATP-dependent Lon protease
LLRFSIEGRKRVKDQILRIDSTMAEVKFGYSDNSGSWNAVTTLEEQEHPAYYRQIAADNSDDNAQKDPASTAVAPPDETPAIEPPAEPLFEGHREFQENQRGVTYELLFGPYLQGASEITITDPYIRRYHQARNLMELVEQIVAQKDPADEVTVKLITCEENENEDLARRQLEFLTKVQLGAAAAGVHLVTTFDGAIHDRSIVTDSGWRILLGRGLDIFQYVANDAFDLASRLQEFRQVKAFGITYVRTG